MGLKSYIRAKVQTFVFKPTEDNESLRAEIQAFISPTVLSGPLLNATPVNDGRGNQYLDYGTQVTEIWKNYRAQSSFGSAMTRSIVNYRTGWIAGNGISFDAQGKKKELEWLNRFIKLNRLDGSTLTKAVRGGEIEGKALLILTPAKDPFGEPYIKVRYARWTKLGYTINTSETDDNEIVSVSWDNGEGSEPTVLKPNQFTYVNLDNSGQDINSPTPTLAPVLTNIESMDKAMADWRQYNEQIAFVGLHYEVQDQADADSLNRAIQKNGAWSRGDTLAARAKATYPEPTGGTTDSLQKEVDQNARIVSGQTGVPIHLLGWASQMSNRSTAEEMMESVTALTAESRDIVEESMVELAIKAMIMWNEMQGDSLRPEFITATLAQVTRQQIKDLIEIYVPLAEGGFIPDDEVRSRIPGTDMATLKQGLELQDEENAGKQVALMEQMRAEPDDETNENPNLQAVQ